MPAKVLENALAALGPQTDFALMATWAAFRLQFTSTNDFGAQKVIREVSGNILLSDAQVIAHGVSPDDHFDKGLALALRQRWPAMAKDFRHWAHGAPHKPGEVWAWIGSDGKKIVNLLTQEAGDGAHTGRAKIEHLNRSLKALREFCAEEGVTSVALPKLATGAGGLLWSEVKPVIEKHLGDLMVSVYDYDPYSPTRTWGD